MQPVLAVRPRKIDLPRHWSRFVEAQKHKSSAWMFQPCSPRSAPFQVQAKTAFNIGLKLNSLTSAGNMAARTGLHKHKNRRTFCCLTSFCQECPA